MDTKFNDIDWHDAELIGLNIDRQNPGNLDIVELKLRLSMSRYRLSFENVYYADIRMNFNIIADETIRSAFINGQDEYLSVLKGKWIAISPPAKDIMCFELNTNSTNSIIKIYALDYKLERL